MSNRFTASFQAFYEGALPSSAPRMYVVGNPIPTIVSPLFFSQSRQKKISNKTIMNSYNENLLSYNSLNGAQEVAKSKVEQALRLENKKCVKSVRIKKFDCAIFEVKGKQILSCHFQGKKIPMEKDRGHSDIIGSIGRGVSRIF